MLCSVKILFNNLSKFCLCQQENNKDITASMDKDVLFTKINEGIIEERYDAFSRNLNKNIPLINKHGGLQRVISKFKDKHVIIIGAGTSLNNEIHLLKKYQNRNELLIISTDMALRPLIKRKIFPSFVISCETMPVDYFSAIETDKMHLLAFSCMSNSNIRKWKGDISFYNWMIHNNLYDNLWRVSGDLGFVATGSIVTTQAIAFALGCAVKSIMILGNDLSYINQFYTTETIVYTNNKIKTSRFSPVETIEYININKRKEYQIIRGENIYYTNNQFLSAKLWLENLFKEAKLPIFDNSSPGCSETSVKKMRLKEYFKIIDSH